MASRSKQPSKTAIKKILSECAFDPRKCGPMKVIADVGYPTYYATRAIEMLTETPAGVQSKHEVQMAIGLLALYLATGAFEDA